MADCDLAHFTQVWCLDSELVLCALFKVVLAIIESSFTFKSNKHGISCVT